MKSSLHLLTLALYQLLLVLSASAYVSSSCSTTIGACSWGSCPEGSNSKCEGPNCVCQNAGDCVVNGVCISAAARRTCSRLLLISCSSGLCDDPNAQCVDGFLGKWCECAEPLCAVSGVCSTPTTAPSAAPTTATPTTVPTPPGQTLTPTLMPTVTPTVAPTTGLSLKWLGPVVKPAIEHALDTYLTNSTLCNGTLFDSSKPCAVEQLKNASCTPDLNQTAFALHSVESMLQLSVTEFSVSCELEVEITGTIPNIPVLGEYTLNRFTLTKTLVDKVGFSWNILLNFTDGFPSGASSVVESAGCFTGSITIEANKSWWDQTQAGVVNSAVLPAVLPTLVCETLPQSLIDQQLDTWLNKTSHVVLEADTAVTPVNSTMNNTRMHSWVGDPLVDMLHNLTMFLNSPNATQWENQLPSYLQKPLVIHPNQEGIIQSINISGLETFRILNISSTADPQVLRLAVELANATVTLFGTGFTATLGFDPLEMDMEATVAIDQSQIDTFLSHHLSSQRCWITSGIESTSISKLNVSFSDMQLTINSRGNHEFDHSFIEFMLVPLEQALGGSFSQVIGQVGQGPIRAELNERLRDLTKQFVANPNCIDHSDTQLSGTLQQLLRHYGVSSLTALEKLYLENTRLSGTIYAGFSSLTALRWLDVSHSRLSGTLVAGLSSLTALQWLTLSNTRLSGTMAGFSSLTALQRLDVGDTRLSGTMHTELSSLTALEALTVSHTQLSGTLQPGISLMTALQSFHLSRSTYATRVSGAIPSGILNLTSLLSVELANSQISGTVLTGFSSLSLYHLDLSNSTRLSGTMVRSTAVFVMFQGMKALSGTLPEYDVLPNRTEMIRGGGAASLRVGQSRISGSLPQALLKGQLMFDLDASDTHRLSGTIANNISSPLCLLSLQGNRISGSISAGLLGIRHLAPWILAAAYLISLSGVQRIYELHSLFNPGLTLNIGKNRLSGTIPNNKNATIFIQLAADDNRLSGTLSIVTMPFCYLLSLGTNFLSGSISSSLSSLTALEYLLLYNNMFSGTLSPHLGSLTALKTLDVGANSLVGSSPILLGSWHKLTLLAINKNSGLDWNMTMLNELPSLQQALMYNCRITGTLPKVLPLQLEVLVLRENYVSGSIHHSMFRSGTKLHILELSGNMLSASLPTGMCNCSSMQSVLVNDMHLSGSLPECSRSSRRQTSSFYTTLTTLSCARNYLEGVTDPLARSNALQTLILASNFLDGDVIPLLNATSLGTGMYQDPAEKALKEIGVEVQQTATRSIQELITSNSSNPVLVSAKDILNWASEKLTLCGERSCTRYASDYLKAVASNPFRFQQKNYSAIALSFPGNTQLTTQAGFLNSISPGRVLQADSVRSGSHSIFGGHAAYKMTIWVTLPTVVALHLCTLVVVVGSKQILSYYSPSLHVRRVDLRHRHGICMTALKSIRFFVVVLAVCGMLVLTLNLSVPALTNHCSPALRQTSACVSRWLPQWYQYLWCISICVVFGVACAMCRRLWGDCEQESSVRTYACLLFFVQSNDRRVDAVTIWRSRVWEGTERKHRGHLHVSLNRYMYYWALKIPMMFALSAPAFFYGALHATI